MGNTKKFGIPAIIAAIAACLACICCGVIVLYFYGDTLLGNTNVSNPSNPSQSIVPADSSNLPEWTVIVYSDADDDILEEDLWRDVNEMELTGSSSQVNVVVQMDRAEGSFSGDGDWTGTRRYYITQDSDMNHINSQLVQDMGELDMGNPQTLVDFVTWSIQNYPAKKYALIMSDHGGGWTGGFSDKQSGSQLSFAQITDAIQQIQQSMNGQKFEVIGFDACLMGMAEVYGSLYPYTNYMVASEEVIPATGWSYAAWLGQLTQNPTMNGADLTKAIVSTYITQDAYLQQAGTPAEIEDIQAGTTLSAIDSSRMPDVISSMNQFIATVANVNQEWVAQGREYTRSYYSIFGEDVPSPFIDLGNFADVMATTQDPAIQQATTQLDTAIASAVIAEKHGSRMSGSTGISFYFPISKIYSYTELNSDFPPLYKNDAYKFLQQSSWDEFLAYHYTGMAFAPQTGQAYEPPKSSQVFAPGASKITIDPIQLSTTNLSGDQKLTLNTSISGNVSYIYFALYFHNKDTNSYWLGDMSYVFSENTTTVGGANAPDYGPSPVQVSYEWEPSLFALKDGQHESFALFQPDEYLSASGISTYSVYGQYTYANGTGKDNVKMVFDPDGNLLNIFALVDADNNGITTPVAIKPQIGDQFTDYVQSYVFDANGNASYDNSLSNDVFTYGSQGFWFEAKFPVAGEYALGFIAYDFDNNPTSVFQAVNYTP